MKQRFESRLAAVLAAAVATWAAAGPHARVVRETVTLPGGISIAYVEQGREGARTVIFLHGYTDSSVSFETVLERLDPSIHAVAIDQRGHGESSRPECCYGMEQFADDVVAFMDARGIRSATLVGHSMGGPVAQLVALRHPGRVDGLVLVGTAATFRAPAVQELVAAVRQLEGPVDPAFAREFQASTVYKPLPEGHLDRYVAESLRLPARTWKAVVEGIFAADLTSRLSDVRCPTLVIWGDRDGVALREDQETFGHGIKGAQLKVYEEIGHAVHWEVPDRFVKDLVEFLSRKS